MLPFVHDTCLRQYAVSKSNSSTNSSIGLHLPSLSMVTVSTLSLSDGISQGHGRSYSGWGPLGSIGLDIAWSPHSDEPAGLPPSMPWPCTCSTSPPATSSGARDSKARQTLSRAHALEDAAHRCTLEGHDGWHGEREGETLVSTTLEPGWL